MSIEQIVGLIAGLITAGSLIPQLIKTVKERKSEDVSVLMLVILFVGVSLWIWYGWLRKDWPILITNSFSLIINAILMIFKYRFRKNS